MTTPCPWIALRWSAVLALAALAGACPAPTHTPSAVSPPAPDPADSAAPPAVAPAPAGDDSAPTETAPSAATASPTAPASTPPAAASAGPGGAAGDMLAAHNQFRARHCAPPLAWSDELAQVAQRWADKLRDAGCAFQHSADSRYGENLAFFAPPGSHTPAQTAEGWYREVDGYNFSSPGFSMQTGHFTQLVWVNTQRLGCGRATCGGGELWVCNYDPPGNVRTLFKRNVLPTGCK